MAISTTRLQGIRARDSRDANTGKTLLVNQLSRPAIETRWDQTQMRERAKKSRRQHLASVNRRNELRSLGTLREEQNLREWARLALAEKNQDFAHEMAERRFDLQNAPATGTVRQTGSTLKFPSKMGEELTPIQKAELQKRKIWSKSKGRWNLDVLPEDYPLDGSDRIKQLREAAPQEMEVNPLMGQKRAKLSTKDAGGYYARAAVKHLGVAESELFDEKGLTQRGSDFMDAIDFFSEQYPQAHENALLLAAAEHVGLRTEGQRQRFDLAAELRDAQTRGDKKAVKAIREQMKAVPADGKNAFESWWNQTHRAPKSKESGELQDVERKTAVLGQAVLKGTDEQRGRAASVLLDMLDQDMLSPMQQAQIYQAVTGKYTEDAETIRKTQAKPREVFEALGIKEPKINGRRYRSMPGTKNPYERAASSRSSAIAHIAGRMKLSKAKAEELYDSVALVLPRQKLLLDELLNITGDSSANQEHDNNLRELLSRYGVEYE